MLIKYKLKKNNNGFLTHFKLINKISQQFFLNLKQASILQKQCWDFFSSIGVHKTTTFFISLEDVNGRQTLP